MTTKASSAPTADSTHHARIVHGVSTRALALASGASVPASTIYLRGHRTPSLYAALGIVLHYATPLLIPFATSEDAHRLVRDDLATVPSRDRDPVRRLLGHASDQTYVNSPLPEGRGFRLSA